MIRSPDVLCRRLGYQFNTPGLLESALTHRSAGGGNYERMEFLGDAILSLVISEQLYQRFPQASEGQLSRLRSSLVKGDTLAELAKGFELGEYLHLGQGELKSGGFRRESILADALEAIFGAVYLDRGLEAVSELILRIYDGRIQQLTLDVPLKDPKTLLQEYLQSRRMAVPEYKTIDVQGEDHSQHFRVSCRIVALNLSSEGEGVSRRKAEQDAAMKLLSTIEK